MENIYETSEPKYLLASDLAPMRILHSMLCCASKSGQLGLEVMDLLPLSPFGKGMQNFHETTAFRKGRTAELSTQELGTIKPSCVTMRLGCTQDGAQ